MSFKLALVVVLATVAATSGYKRRHSLPCQLLDTLGNSDSTFGCILSHMCAFRNNRDKYYQFDHCFRQNEVVARTFAKHEVVPDVINVAPASVAKVSFKSGVSANLGNKLTPTLVKDIPTVSYDADPECFYTLVMTDPDAPENPEFHHWLVGNIPGSKVSKGETLSAYIGSGPPEGDGYHRYVILVYKQPKKLTFTEKRFTNTQGEGRENFSIRNFAKKYNLGNPVAGNFYQAEYDDYVPILYAQLVD